MRAMPVVVVAGCFLVAVGSQFVFGRAPAPAAAVEAAPAAVPGPMRAVLPAAGAEAAPVTAVRAVEEAPDARADKAAGAAKAGKERKKGAAVVEAGLLPLRGRLQGFEAARKSHGTVDLVRTDRGVQARLSDFATTPGASLEVWLVSHPDPKKPADLAKAKTLSLGALRSAKGDQIYTLPDGVDPGQYKSLVIFSKDTNVLFAAAPLKGGA